MRFVNIAVTDGCKKSELWMYIVGIVVLKYFQLFSVKNWSIPAIFLGAFTAQSSLWVLSWTHNKTQSTSSSNPDKVVQFLPVLVFISTSGRWNVKLVLSFASFCLRIISVFILHSLSICSEMFPVCYFGLSTNSRASEQKQKKPVLLCFSATR